MNCPKCKTVILRKKGYDSPETCNICGGFWLENENVPGFVENAGTVKSIENPDNRGDHKTGICPAGHGIMIRAKVDVDDPFYLEKCSTCGGIWFDQGEWQRVLNNNLVESLSELWCRSWQMKQRQEKNRDNYLESNKKFFGNDIFQKIIQLSELLRDHPEKGRAVALLQNEIVK